MPPAADIWGFPKWVTTIDIDEPAGAGPAAAGTGTTVRLVDDGVHVLTLTVAAGGRLHLPAQAPPSYSFADGVLRRTRVDHVVGGDHRPVGRGHAGARATTRWPTSSDPGTAQTGAVFLVRGPDAGVLRRRRGGGRRDDRHSVTLVIPLRRVVVETH